MFTGSNHVTFPQWRKDSLANLRSSGTIMEVWHTNIKQKISQEAISDKSVDKIMRDLALHFDCSHKIVANLTRLHVKAG